MAVLKSNAIMFLFAQNIKQSYQQGNFRDRILNCLTEENCLLKYIRPVIPITTKHRETLKKPLQFLNALNDPHIRLLDEVEFFIRKTEYGD